MKPLRVHLFEDYYLTKCNSTTAFFDIISGQPNSAILLFGVSSKKKKTEYTV